MIISPCTSESGHEKRQIPRMGDRVIFILDSANKDYVSGKNSPSQDTPLKVGGHRHSKVEEFLSRQMALFLQGCDSHGPFGSVVMI